MIRRLLGALLCLVLIGVSSSAAYADATKKNYTFTLEIETSYFSLDSMDDVSDAAPPSQQINWSLREKSASNFLLGPKVRKIKFTPPSMMLFEQTAQPRPASQDIFRFQEVYRI